jgi:two-component system, OmpR family, sensor histidine kinase BaeS
MGWDTSWRSVNLLSLRWKLGGALLLVVLLSVGIMAYLTNQNTTAQFQQYLQSGNSAYTQRLVNILEQFYAQQQNWGGVQEILVASLRSNGDRLILADSSLKIVGDTANQLIGKPAATLSTDNGTSIHATGKVVGTLYLSLSSTGSGRGYMGGRGTMGVSGSPTQTNIQTSEGNFLSRVNSYIWIAGIISISVALLLGIFLTRQITRPLRSLDTGAKHLSEGDLTYRVKVHSNDEIGRVALSFNDMAVKLENSEESRRRLVSDVAHELRTPLTIIQGTVDGIKDGVFQPDEEHLNSIREQTLLLTHLVNDLRDLSLAESGQLKLDRQPSDIVDLVKRKITQFEVNARQKNIRLLLQSQPGIPSISIDTRRIEQVLGNLLSNAIRHTPEGGQIQISVKVAGNDLVSGKNSLIVSVSDTGEGIPAEHLPHIFERFYRVETSRSRSQGGAGLGLAIVKQMVRAHGGQVWVESQSGKGSTFYFSLPYNYYMQRLK